MLPVGGVISSLLAGIVADKWGWQYMCVIVGAVDAIDVIC